MILTNVRDTIHADSLALLALNIKILLAYVTNSKKSNIPTYAWPVMSSGLCSTHESWVKFDSILTQMSRVRVESRWSSFESELSQLLDTAWVKVESMIFRGENFKILQSSVTLQRKNQPTATFDRTPPPRQQLFPKLGKMWWVVSQIWLNSDSNELIQSWVRLVNLGFELSLSWVRLANLGFELSRSWVTWIVIWVRVESARKNESSTTLDVINDI